MKLTGGRGGESKSKLCESTFVTQIHSLSCVVFAEVDVCLKLSILKLKAPCDVFLMGFQAEEYRCWVLAVLKQNLGYKARPPPQNIRLIAMYVSTPCTNKFATSRMQGLVATRFDAVACTMVKMFGSVCVFEVWGNVILGNWPLI